MNEEKSEDTFTIKIKKENMWKYSTFVLAALLIVGAIVFFTSDSTTGQVVNNPAQQLPTQGGNVVASVDNDAVLGDKNAPVTIIEFSDYQCPFCGRFWSETLPQIKKDYIDTGKVKLVFRDFPLTSIHPMAQKASEAVECVREKGGDSAYYKMHDKVFANQASLSNDNLKKWAKELGYDISNCLDSGKFASEVTKDSTDAQAAGGRGTPYFVINGQALSGAQPYQNFKAVIDAALNA